MNSNIKASARNLLRNLMTGLIHVAKGLLTGLAIMFIAAGLAILMHYVGVKTQ